ncbi:MAG: hypothetical protein ACJ8C4_03700 [Gemmataceae bacterium]
MEHLLFHLIVETIQAIDRRLQRPLSAAIPDLTRLRTDPHSYLSDTPITFGPRRRKALATVIGAFAGFLVVILLMLILPHGPRQRGIDWSRFVGVLVSFAVVTWLVRSLVIHWLLGGTATLQPEGVSLVYRNRSVFLPWPLFQAGGTKFEPDQKLVVLPIDPTVPVAVSGPEDQVAAILPTELNLPQAESNEGQLALKDLYDVRIGELGGLLSDIGWRLRGHREFDLPDSFSIPPIAVPDKDGWLNVQLTQLPFPPFCSGCGTETGQNLAVMMVKANQMSTIAVPFCDTCATTRHRRRILGAVTGLGVGLAIALIVALAIAAPAFRPERFLLAIVVLGFGFGLPGVVIGQGIGRSVGLPVRCKDYRPDKGTVRLQLRDPVRAAPLLKAMGLMVLSEPDEAGVLR